MTPAELSAWLVVEATARSSSRLLFACCCSRLSREISGLCRANLALYTLHPEVDGVGETWRNGVLSDTVVFPTGELQSERYRSSPLAALLDSGKPLRMRISREQQDYEFPILKDLAQSGVTEYVAFPLALGEGHVGAISFASEAEDGFSAEAFALLEAAIPPISLAVGIYETRRLAVTVLNTYLGLDAGARVLAGQIHRGDGDPIYAAIWYNDLRGFSQLSHERDPHEVIELLNSYFECMAASVERHGGQVLKFIGDAMLAIFPIAGPTSSQDACKWAYTAGREALLEIEALNQKRNNRPIPIDVGLALHLGHVVYGNIGSQHRLDFTVIGNAVNESTRIEGMCSRLAEPLLMSNAFAKELDSPTRKVTEVELRGIPGGHVLFAPPK